MKFLKFTTSKVCIREKDLNSSQLMTANAKEQFGLVTLVCMYNFIKQ